jgi:GTP:adenosylcobinamide-phosphate guanylyltransferase
VALTAVVLAGGPADALVAGDPSAPNKAFLNIGGRPLVARALEPLRATPGIGRIIAVAPPGPRAFAALRDADEIRPDGARIADSLRSGLRGLDPDAPVLLLTADLPVLTSAALEEFLRLGLAGGADIVYACVERRTHEARYPGVPHTWARLRDGTYCGGGAVLLKPRAFTPLERFLGRLGAARKNPARLAAIFGWDVVARYALGRLAIANVERRATQLLGVPAAAAVCTHPEIAVNVDRPGDLIWAERLVTPNA